jgi:hypothetical protein
LAGAEAGLVKLTPEEREILAIRYLYECGEIDWEQAVEAWQRFPAWVLRGVGVFLADQQAVIVWRWERG